MVTPALPRFAVVGHPNQGKSSVVATLAADDSLAIAPLSGTTVECRRFPMRIDGEPLYELIDTPGFQCPRPARSWLEKQRQVRKLSGPEAVQSLVQTQSVTWPDEARLLQPLIEGAAILYVVDGSVGYDPSKHEDELLILAMTERPSMALINQIGPQTEHVQAWRSVLDKHFKVVREFNAVTAPFEKRIEILRAFAVLNEAWSPALNRAAEALSNSRARRRRDAAGLIAELLADLLTRSASAEVPAESLKSPAEFERADKRLRGHLMQEMRDREKAARVAIERLYQHQRLSRQEQELPAQSDLFSEESWRLYGLKRWQLAVLGGVVGAAAGLVGDAAVGGTSLGLVAAGGGLFGAASGALTPVGWLAKPTQRRAARGAVTLTVGPIKSTQFPFIVLNRARQHHAAVSRRTHADRNVLSLGASVPELSTLTQVSFTKQFSALRDARPAPAPLLAQLTDLITECIAEPEPPSESKRK